MRFVDTKGRYINLDNCIDITYDHENMTITLVMRDNIIITLINNEADKMSNYLRKHSDSLDKL